MYFNFHNLHKSKYYRHFHYTNRKLNRFFFFSTIHVLRLELIQPMPGVLLLRYFSQLSGSGQELREEVRRSYHQLVLMLVEAVQGFTGLNEK